ncbi:uncharacterized protein LOC128549907 [Mercenaria mercenaria]|uniref:uncharacterized protein LOC128549907 n=1 Tax=Mercenaria mercenaria TaxID=6596 RepID=UPI00234E744E|nr:uncharacterized protein LOC128549907 [Mercenaria mercenaria]XP_053383638.1 uncharacterized protein LOC128549907 [Mercenaria mercenaria]
MNMLTGVSDLRRMSCKLTNCLNLNGASNEFIRYRISSFKSMESMHTIANIGKGCLDGFFIGSQIEGGTLLGLDSDADMMFIDREITIITDVDDYKRNARISNKEILYCRTGLPEDRNAILPRKHISNPPIGLIDDRDVSPGYAKVIAIDKDTCIPLSKGVSCSLSHLFEVDENENCLFSHQKWKARIALVTPSRYKHGPALTEDSTKDYRSSDFVYGLKSAYWPKSAEEWLTRERLFQWPFQKTIELAKQGCFLVPVGPLPEAKNTEWRLSFTLLERELIWTWTNTQYKCFMLMKVIKRDVIEPEIPDVISSYHLKTVIFWMSEERPFEFWNRENFPTCIAQCLEKLIEFVETGNCPNYFIRGNNMFKGKFSSEIQNQLNAVLLDFSEQFWTKVFELPTFHIAVSAVEDADTECFNDLRTACLRNDTSMKETLNLHFSMLISFATSAMKPMFQLISDRNVDMTISKHEEYLRLLSEVSMNNEEQVNFVNALSNLVNISLGAQWYSKSCNVQSLAEKNEMLQRSEYLIKNGSCLDTSSGKLKLATLHFARGDTEQCLHLVQVVLSREHAIQLSGFEPTNPEGISMEYVLRILHKLPDFCSEIREHCALEVVFLPSEIDLAPAPIKFEISRAIHAERDCDLDNPLRWVAIDANFYAVLLKFLVAHKHGMMHLRDTTLSQIKAYVAKKGVPFVRSITALNIAGFCLQLVGDIDWAVDVFLGSLIMQRTHNSAYWHLAVLIWNEWEKTQ